MGRKQGPLTPAHGQPLPPISQQGIEQYPKVSPKGLRGKIGADRRRHRRIAFAGVKPIEPDAEAMTHEGQLAAGWLLTEETGSGSEDGCCQFRFVSSQAFDKLRRQGHEASGLAQPFNQGFDPAEILEENFATTFGLPSRSPPIQEPKAIV